MAERPSAGPDVDPKGFRGGSLFVVSAPSGAGKTTICRSVLKRMPDLLYSVSFTTRAPRPGEVDGRDYHFISDRRFRQKIDAGEWAEWAFVHGNYYGTSATFIERGLAGGKDILLDIDVQGARQIVTAFPDSVTIFVLPPSFDELRRRLESRATDDRQIIDARLKNASWEIAQKDLYRYQIVNDDLETAIGAMMDVIARCRSARPPTAESNR